jgi:hypothetical protein
MGEAAGLDFADQAPAWLGGMDALAELRLINYRRLSIFPFDAVFL